ncbi:MAG: hypothetical protein Ct9H300mP23_09910 [Nitrospinota bacterium]|nr:MAG: hypothetical protein Ct9H300mP23_09910 [Nitrospinota bacterium]
MGFSDEDFQKPIVGVANGQSESLPAMLALESLPILLQTKSEKKGNASNIWHHHHQRWNFHGNRRMKCSLISRDVIADSIETVCRVQAWMPLFVLADATKTCPEL